jgi:uncharacterized protein YabN with tetrapyrrole methylase and pyrophosphatase domain
MNTIDSLTNKIYMWGEDRGIVQNGKNMGQAIKMLEEVTELLDAINSNNREEIKDALGDVYVTLVMTAATSSLTPEECIAKAYDEIKYRTGYLTPAGVFVKDK